ncbi:DUF551 domain-containing protein [Citrobacter sp. Cb023]|uniref:DUF551 domain-containing protein n=1 Tax=Citrobacter sp. Cb023 TaxID=2985020 RepID=UPI0025765867|nr:DUF551 domain-containing protein [Citrobacter sp. Cb023]MDM3430864.1 DUF551 domain-containing protein [Citrobacter sp. Cb023]
MTTNHPANGPVSLDRLHQISEILSKAAAQSDGSNLGYAMADAVKVIDGAIAARNVETIYQVMYGECWRDITEEQYHDHAIHESPIRIVYTAPPAQLVPEEVSWEDVPEEITEDNMEVALAWAHGFNHCRTAMLQAGNSPVAPDTWIPVSERMPERDIDVQVYCADKKEQMVGYMERNEADGWFRFASLPNGGGVYCKPTHWMELPAAPKQEVNHG